MTMPIGPRRLTALRRVTIPTRAALKVGVKAQSWVTISAHRRDHGVLVIRPAADSDGDYGLRDPRRARKISGTGQLALPAVLLDRAGIAVGDWVAFTISRTGLRLFSADRVRGPEIGAT